MDEARLVDAEGWISDESDFYGSTQLRKQLETKAKRRLTLPHIKFPVHFGRSQVLHHFDQGAESEGRQITQRDHHVHATSKSSSAAVKAAVNVKSGSEATNLVDNNEFEGNPAAWQHHETIPEFMRRAPVDVPSTADFGSWLWVGAEKVKRIWQKLHVKIDGDAFKEGGVKLLNEHAALRAKREVAAPAAMPAWITRKLGPYRDQLQNDLLALAVETGITYGEWMLFPSDEEYPRYWRTVAEATAEGKLGPTSKAATPDPVDPLNLICIYTYDFSDADDVRRVLEELIDLGLCIRDGKPIYYKCDAHTYLDIKSDSKYKLRASMYSSKELLQSDAKQKRDGPVDRVQRNKETLDSSWMF